eukprot:COSAG06_NODE_40940_length_396_cov_8.895623_1_plen_66_part_10
METLAPAWKLDMDEESARRWMAALPAQQQSWVFHLRRESALWRMQEVLALRTPVLSRKGEGVELDR